MTVVDGPTWVGETDVADVAGLQVEPTFRAARLLVTAGADAVGQITVPLHDGTADAVTLSDVVRAAVGAIPPAREVPDSVEPLTVVIPTRGRPRSLARTVRSVLACDHPDLTVLVVENSRMDCRSASELQAIGDPRVRYLRERRGGTSAARNLGLAEARTRIVAFTDDDTEVDPSWARRIAGTFADPEVACVTGPVLAASLGSEPELAADPCLGFDAGFRPRRFSLGAPPDESPVFPFGRALLGRGGNLAVRVDTARTIGGFDEALGPGTALRGGEDREFLVRMVLAGHVLAYEPAARVRHHHPTDMAAMRSQVAGDALGLAGFLTKVLLSPQGRSEMARRVPGAIRGLGRTTPAPAVHGRGALASGPARYLWARARARRRGAQVPPLVAGVRKVTRTEHRPLVVLGA